MNRPFNTGSLKEYCSPSLMSLETGLVFLDGVELWFMAAIVAAENRYVPATIKKTPAVSNKRIRNPAHAGPKIRVKFILE